MINNHTFELYAAPHTPMGPDGQVDLEAVERQAQRLVETGVTGAFLCGTTGESWSLSVEERMHLTERWMAVAGDRLRIVVHVGHNAVHEAQRLARHAADAEVHAIASIAPNAFIPASVEDLSAFLEEIASTAADLPFYFYHIPSMTRCEVSIPRLLRFAAERIPSLRGVKYTHHDLMEFQECLEMDGGRFEMMFGRDELLLPSLGVGARRAVGSTYNFAAPLYRRLAKAFDAGDLATARWCQANANQMIRVIVDRYGFPGLKATMGLVGCDCGPCRLPLRTLSPDDAATLREELESIGFFEWSREAVEVRRDLKPAGVWKASRSTGRA